MKPGYKTTEFWGVAAASGLTVLNQAFTLGLSDQTIATLAGLAASYAVARGLAKKPDTPA
mgnify:CR=1 FL=1